MLPVGSPAPDFRLRLDSGTTFHLEDAWRSHVVILAFLPHAPGFDSSRDGHILSGRISEIQSLGATMVAVSPFELRQLRRFATEHHLELPIARDPSMEVCRMFGVVWLRGSAIRRTTYVIDRGGVIRGRLNHELLVDRHWTSVLRILGEVEARKGLDGGDRKASNR